MTRNVARAGEAGMLPTQTAMDPDRVLRSNRDVSE